MSPTYTIVCTGGELQLASDLYKSSDLAIDGLLGRAEISFIVKQLQLVNDLVLHEPGAALPAPVI